MKNNGQYDVRSGVAEFLADVITCYRDEDDTRKRQLIQECDTHLPELLRVLSVSMATLAQFQTELLEEYMPTKEDAE